MELTGSDFPWFPELDGGLDFIFRIFGFGKLQIPFKPKILPSICCKHVANNKGNRNTKKKIKKNARKDRIQHEPTRERTGIIYQPRDKFQLHDVAKMFATTRSC